MVDHWPVSYSLSEEERKLIDDFRREKTLINAENEQSPNMKAVEDIERLKQYIVSALGLNSENCVSTIIEQHSQLVNSINVYANTSDLNIYQTKASETTIYPGKGTPLGLIYCALKLSGEAGEVAENVGKALRDDELFHLDKESEVIVLDEVKEDRRNKIKLELGDVLWYISQAAKELGYSLEEIAQANLEKLGNRAKNGTLKGSGDDR